MIQTAVRLESKRGMSGVDLTWRQCQPFVIVNRFMINLRQVHEADDMTILGSLHYSQFSVPNFRVPSTFLGNIGEPLVDGGIASDIENAVDLDESDAVRISS